MTRPRHHSTPIAALVYKRWRGDLRELARNAEIHPSTLHRVLNGTATPALTTVRALASALGISAERLVRALP